MGDNILKLLDECLAIGKNLTVVSDCHEAMIAFAENQEKCRASWHSAEEQLAQAKLDLSEVEPKLKVKDATIVRMKLAEEKQALKIANLEKRNQQLNSKVDEIMRTLGDYDNVSADMRRCIMAANTVPAAETMPEEHQNPIRKRHSIDKENEFERVLPPTPLTKRDLYDWQAATKTANEMNDDEQFNRLVVDRTKNSGGRHLKKKQSHFLMSIPAPKNVLCCFCQSKIGQKDKCYRCDFCHKYLHQQCKDKFTENCFLASLNLADFTIGRYPRVPRLLKYCMIEVERRGPGETGLYRVGGSKKDVDTLLETYINTGVVSLKKVNDVNALTALIKKFLARLSEPMVTLELRDRFIELAMKEDRELMQRLFYVMPQEYRDTLSVICLHLKKISQSKDITMDIFNLSRVFAPTLVGVYDDTALEAYNELSRARKVVEQLLTIPNTFYLKVLEDAKSGVKYRSGEQNHKKSERKAADESEESLLIDANYMNNQGFSTPQANKRRSMLNGSDEENQDEEYPQLSSSTVRLSKYQARQLKNMNAFNHSRRGAAFCNSLLDSNQPKSVDNKNMGKRAVQTSNKGFLTSLFGSKKK